MPILESEYLQRDVRKNLGHPDSNFGEASAIEALPLNLVFDKVLARHFSNHMLERGWDRSLASFELPAPEKAEALAAPGV